ncbi:MAG: hypothetical protein F4142_09215 [Nitrospira sp. SB0675_bin_23]|nr:hypothetical protein [Nitrospira sp. SB0675_bin_23]
MSIDLSALTAGMMLGEEMEYTIQPGASQDSGQVMFGCPAGGSACMVTVNADGTATYDGNGGTPTVMNTQAAITAAENAAKAVRAMAAKIAPAIADPDGDGVFPEAGDLRGTGNASSADNANNSSATASSRPGGAGVTITTAVGGAVTVDPDGPATDDTATTYADVLGMDDKWNHDVADDADGTATPDRSRENQFEMQTAAPPTLADFAGSVYERTMDKVTDTLTVYTNVEDVKAEAYNTYFAREPRTTDGTNPNGRPTIVSEAVDPSADDYDGTLMFGTFTAADHASLFGGSFFVRTDSPTKTLPGAAGDNNANERPGTFAGVPGKFICTADCAFTFNGEGGALSGISGTLTFEPTSTDVQVPNVIRDRDFLTFGYWLQATEDDKGETTYGVRTFATGGMPYVDITNTPAGNATYSGEATGMYVRKTDVDGDDKGPVPTSSGQFTAVANLTAEFGTRSSVPADYQNKIRGTITAFKDGNDIIDNDWTVTLKPADFSTLSSSAPTFAGMTMTGEESDPGEWEGRFFGSLTGPDGDDAGTDPDPIVPGSVAGEFNGHFSNGHVIGAFGATQDKKE